MNSSDKFKHSILMILDNLHESQKLFFNRNRVQSKVFLGNALYIAQFDRTKFDYQHDFFYIDRLNSIYALILDKIEKPAIKLINEVLFDYQFVIDVLRSYLYENSSNPLNPLPSNSIESIDGGEVVAVVDESNNDATTPFIPNALDFNQIELPADKYPVYLEDSTLTVLAQYKLAEYQIFTFCALWAFSQSIEYQALFNDKSAQNRRIMSEIERIIFDMSNCNWSKIYKNWSD